MLRGSAAISSPCTDHTVVGYLYLATSFAYFCFGGVLALIIRAQLFLPGLGVVQTKEQYNQLFTMHGTVMMLLFATPLFTGFANVIMPLQIGAPDVAFPSLNALSFWLFFVGAALVVGGFLAPQGSADFRWTAYTPHPEVYVIALPFFGIVTEVFPVFSRPAGTH